MENIESEKSEFNKLINKLREITADGSSYNFEVTPKGTKNSYFYGVGLDDDFEPVLTEWLNKLLVHESNCLSTEYKLTIRDNTIHLDCLTTFGHWQDANKYNNKDLFTQEIVKLLLPDYELGNVNLDELALPFRYTQNDEGFHFDWPFFIADYYDHEKDLIIDIPLDDLKPKLEPLLREILIHFKPEVLIDFKGSCTKIIESLDNSISILETFDYSLSFDIDKF